MADQVNLLGGLVSEMGHSLQALQSFVAPSSSQSPPSTRSVESRIQASTSRAEDQEDAVIPEENLDAATRSVEDFLQQTSPDIAYKVDRDSGRYYFQVIDPKTQKMIRQVPSEEILAMARKVREMRDLNTKEASGFLVDQQG